MNLRYLVINMVFLMSAIKVYSASITVSAAASLKDTMLEIQKEYKLENARDELIFNFGSSGSLQRQIENGAPVDVFISAGEKQVNELEKENLLLENTRINLLKNEVVLIVPSNSSLFLIDYEDLVDGKIKTIGIGDPKSVPAGQYGMEVFDYLELSEKLNDKFVYGKNVRAVLSWVETENVDAGIVYKTDAVISTKVKIVEEAPAGSHRTIIYPAAIIKDSGLVEESQKFLDFLRGDKARKIFLKFGFKPFE